MGKVYFISGIDTGIGKTVAVGMMCRSLQAAGRKWISVKMVQTGCRGFAEDLEVHRKLAGVGKFPEDEAGLTAPQIFGYPASPLLAARLEGGVVDLDGIARAVAEVARRYELVLVEGAGGLCVPLTENELAVDFAAREGWPLILVTSGRLGAINHTLLSLLFRTQIRGIVIPTGRLLGHLAAHTLINSSVLWNGRYFFSAFCSVFGSYLSHTDNFSPPT